MASIRKFGTTSDGVPVSAIDLAAGELRATVLTLGATIQDVRLAGAPWPLTIGGLSPAAYEGPLLYAGAIVGPVANRIGNATAMIGETKVAFAANEGPTLLHSGRHGFHAKVWSIADASDNRVVMTLDVADRADGFPGDRRITATFEILQPSTLRLTITATTDRPTLMNPANHSYWNLDGEPTTEGQVLTVAADRYTPVDVHLIPTGEARPVDGTAFDLRAGRVLRNEPTFDHNFCLASARRPLTAVGELKGRKGVRMRIETTEPGLQIYDGRHFNTAPLPGLTGAPYGHFAGLAIEAQCWPDAPNHTDFPSILLLPEQTYRQCLQLGFARRESD